MSLSVVIVTWNNRNHIVACLTSLNQQGKDLPPEIIVVDNGSEDGTDKIISRDFSTARLIRNMENLGFTKACNRGLRESTGRHILLLNPDTVIKPQSLNRMVQYMQTHPQVSALGPQLLFPNGQIQPSCRQFPTYSLMLWEFTGLSILFPHSRIFGSWRMGYFDHRQLRAVDQPMGACLLLDRSVIEEVGDLDERFEMFFSDVDICRRMKDAGRKIVFLPTAHVVHDIGCSIRRARVKMLVISHRDCYRYFKKYRCKPMDFLYSWLLGVGLLLILPVRLLAAKLRLPFSQF